MLCDVIMRIAIAINGWVVSYSGSPLGFVLSLVGGDGPSDTGEFIGQRDGGDVFTAALFDAGYPLADRIGLFERSRLLPEGFARAFPDL